MQRTDQSQQNYWGRELHITAPSPLPSGPEDISDIILRIISATTQTLNLNLLVRKSFVYA